MDREVGRSSLAPPKGTESENKLDVHPSSGAEIGVAKSKVDSGGAEAKDGSGTFISEKNEGNNNFGHSVLVSSDLGAPMVEAVAKNEDKAREGDLRDRDGCYFAEENVSVGENEAGAINGSPVSEESVTEDGASGEVESESSEGDVADVEISETGEEYEQGKAKHQAAQVLVAGFDCWSRLAVWWCLLVEAWLTRV
ncbi:hypothetical protein U1Q18_039343 [Sarracenia purpurea var. burkii]